MNPEPDDETREALESTIRILGKEYQDVIYQVWRLGWRDGRIDTLYGNAKVAPQHREKKITGGRR